MVGADAEAALGGPAKRRTASDWSFRLSAHGVEKEVETKEGGPEWRWFCSPLEIVAFTRDAENENWGRLLVVTDNDGRRHEWAMPMDMLAGSGEEYRRHLMSLGLRLAPGKFGRDALHEYLSTARPAERARCVGRIGWHGGAFVLPDRTLGATAGERVLLQIAGVPDHAFRVAGDLAGWQREIGRPCVGNSRLAFAVSAALAAALLDLVSAESGGFHFRGPSSIGKTTLLRAAGSVWGGGGTAGYIRNWRATSNGLESVAALHCDTLLCLDELGQVPGNEAGEVAYMLANGVGKQRAARDGSGRRPAAWRTLFLSTGEIGLADKVAEAGRQARAGQEARLVDLPADAGAGLGLFEGLHGYPSADAFVRHLRDATGEQYGAVARAFIEQVAAHRDAAAATVRGAADRFVRDHCPADADGQVQRVARRFALVAAAGELATRMGLLPWPEGEAMAAAARCFGAWLASRGGIGSAERREALAQVRRFFQQHAESRFSGWDEAEEDGRRTINRPALRGCVTAGASSRSGRRCSGRRCARASIPARWLSGAWRRAGSSRTPPTAGGRRGCASRPRASATRSGCTCSAIACSGTRASPEPAIGGCRARAPPSAGNGGQQGNGHPEAAARLVFVAVGPLPASHASGQRGQRHWHALVDGSAGAQSVAPRCPVRRAEGNTGEGLSRAGLLPLRRALPLLPALPSGGRSRRRSRHPRDQVSGRMRRVPGGDRTCGRGHSRATPFPYRPARAARTINTRWEEEAMRDLTEQQRAFVAHLTGTPGAIGNAAEAARLAGYSTRSAKEIAADLLHKPHVRAAVDEAMRAQISGPLAAKAVEVLARILADEGAPLKVWLDAAKTILDRAGVVAVRPEEAARGRDEKKPLAEMSVAELEDFIARQRGGWSIRRACASSRPPARKPGRAERPALGAVVEVRRLERSCPSAAERPIRSERPEAALAHK